MASILLVEDETLIRMMIADMLSDLGHTVAAEAADLNSGMARANESGFDLAVLDVMLGRGSSEPIAETLARRNVPFVFATGYGNDGLPQAFHDRPYLTKPFRTEELERCISTLLSAA